MQYSYDHDRFILRADDGDLQEADDLKLFVKTLDRHGAYIHSLVLSCCDCGNVPVLILCDSQKKAAIFKAILEGGEPGECEF